MLLQLVQSSLHLKSHETMAERIFWSNTNTIFTNSSNITMKNKYEPISNPLTRSLPLLLEYFLWTPYTKKRWFTVVAAQIITSETYNYTKAVSVPFLISWFNKMRVGRTLVFFKYAARIENYYSNTCYQYFSKSGPKIPRICYVL